MTPRVHGSRSYGAAVCSGAAVRAAALVRSGHVVQGAEFVGVGNRLAPQLATRAERVLPQPPQRRGVCVHRDAARVAAGQSVDVIRAEAEGVTRVDLGLDAGR